MNKQQKIYLFFTLPILIIIIIICAYKIITNEPLYYVSCGDLNITTTDKQEVNYFIYECNLFRGVGGYVVPNISNQFQNYSSLTNNTYALLTNKTT